MKTSLKNLSLSASVVLGAIAAMPAMAALTPLTMPIIGGTAPTDFFLRCTNAEVGTIPVGLVQACPSQDPNVWLIPVLGGGPGAPGGHVELAASSEQSGFDFTKYTSLTGKLGNQPFFARSLTASDWFSNDYALTKQFLSDALAAYPGIVLPPGVTFDQLVAGFITKGGPQRFSDPNITYVYKDDTEKVTVGLAGILNASVLLKQAFPGATVPDGVQVSELVYVQFKGQSSYLYSFSATNSGQSGTGGSPGCNGGAPSGIDDPLAKCSYSGGNDPMLKVPEPQNTLGLLAVLGGLLTLKRQGKRSSK
jgi:hypothetical protein